MLDLIKSFLDEIHRNIGGGFVSTPSTSGIDDWYLRMNQILMILNLSI